MGLRQQLHRSNAAVTRKSVNTHRTYRVETELGYRSPEERFELIWALKRGRVAAEGIDHPLNSFPKHERIPHPHRL